MKKQTRKYDRTYLEFKAMMLEALALPREGKWCHGVDFSKPIEFRTSEGKWVLAEVVAEYPQLMQAKIKYIPPSNGYAEGTYGQFEIPTAFVGVRHDDTRVRNRTLAAERVVYANVYKDGGNLIAGVPDATSVRSAVQRAIITGRNVVGRVKLTLREGQFDE